MLDEALFEKWVEKEKRASSNKKRFYTHFDTKINILNRIDSFRRFFSSSQSILQHSFYPFIKQDINTPKYKKTGEKDSKGKSIRKIEIKIRPIAYAEHFDAAIYSWYSTILTAKYELKIRELDIYENVLAYLEKEESNIQFANRVFTGIKKKGYCAVLTFDIKSFFDNVDHEYLKKMWCKVLDVERLPKDHFQIFKSLTNYSYVERGDLDASFPELIKKREKGNYIERICSPNEFREIVRRKGLIKNNPFVNDISESANCGKQCGIPQGSPISACLSNIFMMDFDLMIAKWIKDEKGIYYRYCDDIIIITEEDKINTTKNKLSELIRKFHLEINISKTEVVVFRIDKEGKFRGFNSENGTYANLQYLGFEFNGKNTYIRSSSMSRYYRRLTARMRENLKASHGKNSMGEKTFKKKLLNRYTHKGKRNFISYVNRAHLIMESETIQRQGRRSIKKMKKKYLQKKKKFETKNKK